jgi:signal transduction histidine kinase
VRDLSEQRRLQAALHRTQKMEIVGRLAGGVAHDFNNLLTVINNGTSMLMSSEAVPNADRGLLEAMKDAADRGAALTRQLTSLSRKQAAQPRVLNVNDMLTSLERILRLLIQTTSIDVRFALDPDIAPVLVDPVHLEEVIINLVINARDAMPAGGTLTIASRNARRPLGVPAGGSGTEPRDVAISVTDTGHGIPPETIPRIFEPFFTTKAEGNGTGLGLATVLSIVEEAGGVVDVTSEVGRGSVFTIYLPAA